MPFTDLCVSVHGCKTHYRRGGKGAPLVFLHGASGAPVVLPFMEKLATRFDVLVPDHPGYGQSADPEGLGNIPDAPYFYPDFLPPLKLEGAGMAGTSLAGVMRRELQGRPPRAVGSPGRAPPPA